MGVKLSNNATSTLASSITDVATSLSVQSGDAALFPALATDEWFPITVIDSSGNMEVMRVTARAGAVFTVTRGQEGSTAQAFDAGSRVDLRLTAAGAGGIVETSIRDATAKTTPVDGDFIGLIDSVANSALKKLTWAKLKETAFVSAALTGTPTAPTANVGTNTTQLASTAFTVAEILARTKTLIQAPTLVTSSNASWALQSDTKFVLVQLVGGGGAGGGAQPGGATNAAAGGGGGSGAISSGFFDVSAVSTLALVIGAGGTPDGSGGIGGNGGTSSYSDGTNTISCPGGVGGGAGVGQSYATSAPGSGPTSAPTGGFNNVPGTSGLHSLAMGDLAMGTGRATAYGGHGANAPCFGSGGVGGRFTGSSGVIRIDGGDATGRGAGGGGGSRCDDSGFALGGAGSSGAILIWEFK